jgi:hypothetical protein
MNCIELIKSKLQKYPQLKFEEQINFINVLPTDSTGFSVSMFKDKVRTHFGMW